MKILIIGGSGLLGNKLVEILNNSNDYDVYATYKTRIIKKQQYYYLDITKENEVKKLFDEINPHITVLCSAYTDVDGCEKNREKAYAINVAGTKNIATIVEKNNGKLIYISTDYVFDGKKGNYSEIDEVHPINYYGRTKLLGEQIIQQICSNHIICRTSVIYGTNKTNFALWILQNLSQLKAIRIVDDQFVSPTYNKDLSEQIIALIEHNQNGVFHTAGDSKISRYEFSEMLAKKFYLNSTLINPVSINDFNWLADRPINSTLNISKIVEFKKPFSLNKALTVFKKEYDNFKKK
jgi:dTDP-4-dehydrorhamnose reductase